MAWVVDYMAQKKLPEPGPSQRMSEYKDFTEKFGFGGMNRVHLSLGGLYDSWSNTSRYYLHDTFTESANSIITILWLHLLNKLETKSPTELTITIDGKSTGMLRCHFTHLLCFRIYIFCSYLLLFIYLFIGLLI
jgi:hypothetical protein